MGLRLFDPRRLHVDDAPHPTFLHIGVGEPIVALKRLAAFDAVHVGRAIDERGVAVNPDLELIDRIRLDADIRRSQIRDELDRKSVV